MMPKIKQSFGRWVGAMVLWVCVGGWAGGVSAQESQRHASSPVRVLMKTSHGEMVVELNRQKAPVTCTNFLSYVHKNFYNGTIFHRVMPNFMIQGGGFTPDMNQKQPDQPIANEWRNGLKNTRGSVAMARLGGRPDSATCQFFINVQNNPGLDQPSDGAGYAVFGQVVGGMDVVDRIKSVATASRGRHQNVPVEPVVIEQVSLLGHDEVPATERED